MTGPWAKLLQHLSSGLPLLVLFVYFLLLRPDRRQAPLPGNHHDPSDFTQRHAMWSYNRTQLQAPARVIIALKLPQVCSQLFGALALCPKRLDYVLLARSCNSIYTVPTSPPTSGYLEFWAMLRAQYSMFPSQQSNQTNSVLGKQNTPPASLVVQPLSRFEHTTNQHTSCTTSQVLTGCCLALCSSLHCITNAVWRTCIMPGDTGQDQRPQ